jgi:hypothetical protein
MSIVSSYKRRRRETSERSRLLSLRNLSFSSHMKTAAAAAEVDGGSGGGRS